MKKERDKSLDDGDLGFTTLSDLMVGRGTNMKALMSLRISVLRSKCRSEDVAWIIKTPIPIEMVGTGCVRLGTYLAKSHEVMSIHRRQAGR